jgi:hypothetical protein
MTHDEALAESVRRWVAMADEALEAAQREATLGPA